MRPLLRACGSLKAQPQLTGPSEHTVSPLIWWGGRGRVQWRGPGLIWCCGWLPCHKGLTPLFVRMWTEIVAPFTWITVKARWYPPWKTKCTDNGGDFIQAFAVGGRFINEGFLKKEGAHLAFPRAGNKPHPPLWSELLTLSTQGGYLPSLCSQHLGNAISVSLSIEFSRSCPTNDSVLLIFASPPPGTVPALHQQSPY